MSKEIKLVIVRVLVAILHQGKPYQPDQLVEFAEHDVVVFKKNGSVDDNKAAIEYCKKELGAEVITHISLEDELAAAEESMDKADSGTASATSSTEGK
ncbi:MAG: hypothetical protein V4493_12355 [Pseudomonadota bacterium]